MSIEDAIDVLEAAGYHVTAPDGDPWPEQTFAAALDVFGGAVYAETGKTRKNLDRRIRHALRVWREKYGPLNPKQEEYADLVLAFAIKKGGELARTMDGTVYAHVQSQIARSVNHETAHEGFKRRAELVNVDVGSLIGAAA